MKTKIKNIFFAVVTYLIGFFIVSVFLSSFQTPDNLDLPVWGYVLFYLYFFGGMYLVYRIFIKKKKEIKPETF